MFSNDSLGGIFDDGFCFPRIIAFSLANFKKPTEDHMVTLQLRSTHSFGARTFYIIHYKCKVCFMLYFNVYQVLHGDVMSFPLDCSIFSLSTTKHYVVKYILVKEFKTI